MNTILITYSIMRFQRILANNVKFTRSYVLDLFILCILASNAKTSCMKLFVP